MSVCSRCGDVALYCSCERTDPDWTRSSKWTNNPSFYIYRGDAEAEWDREGRMLFGDPELVAEIRSKLTGEYVEVLISGFCLWMVEQDPYAVHLVARDEIEGCTFSKSAPKWGKFSKPGRIY